jgi:hypothetical protein
VFTDLLAALAAANRVFQGQLVKHEEAAEGVISRAAATNPWTKRKCEAAPAPLN